MIAKFGLALVALALQYLLLHSHKAGHSHWIWIAPTSVVLFVVGARSVQGVADGKSAGALPITMALLSLLLPPAIYVAREWLHVPASVSNALARDTWFYLGSVTVASGGWLFAILLLWLRRRAGRQLQVSGTRLT